MLKLFVNTSDAWAQQIIANYIHLPWAKRQFTQFVSPLDTAAKSCSSSESIVLELICVRNIQNS
jgi:hypothetical protein